MKPTKESVAAVIRNETGQFLIVKRDPDDPTDKLAGVWGFPAATLKEGESEADALKRIGTSKLGVTLKPKQKIGDQEAERESFTLHLTDYEAEIIDGTPVVPQSDNSVSQYVEWKFTNDPSELVPATKLGSLCSRVFLNSVNVRW